MFEHVFLCPGRIGTLTLAHRVVMGAMHVGLEARADGRALAAFYAERARGGAGLIITGGSAVSRVGAGGPDYSFINESADGPRWEHAIDAVHRAGGRLALQLFHAGRYGSPEYFGLQPLAPSAVPSRFSKATPRAAGAQELTEIIGQFAAGGRRARDLGFDAVEIMGSEGYLLNQFLSPLTNQRDDDWGGDAQRRMRFPLAVAQAVRDAVGAHFPLIYRISAADLMPGSTTEEETEEFARRLAAQGVDALDIGIGWHESSVPTVQSCVPAAAWIAPTARIKRAAGAVPVIAGTRIHAVEVAERVLADGSADFIAMARPFLADADIVAKSRSGHARRVNVCLSCNQACIDRSLRGQAVSCMVNPRAGRELELQQDASPRRRGSFVVIGGGPAGLEAARVFAARGHGVVLYEAQAQLGGQFLLAGRIPGKEVFLRTVAYFEQELERLGAQFRLAHRVAQVPSGGLAGCDGVVLASGVSPRQLSLGGAGLPGVHSYVEAIVQDPGPPAAVAIIGGGGISIDVAHRLSAGGHAVTLLCRGPTVGAHIGRSTRWVALKALRAQGVQILTEVACERITEQGVWIRDRGGAGRLVAAARVVLAVGQVSNDAPLTSLLRAGLPVRVVGGARDTRGLDAVRAFHEGAVAAHELIALHESQAPP